MKFIKILLIFFVLNSCVKKEKIEIDIPIYRFDKEFSDINPENYDKYLAKIESKSHKFTDYYLSNHIAMINTNDSIKRDNILLFTSHPEVISFQQKINNNFPDVIEISDKINESFGVYKYHFPEKEIPKNVIFINAFGSFGIDFYNNNLIIGLDFYLGKENPMFNTVFNYLKTRYDEKFMIADAAEYYLSSEFIETQVTKTFLDELIFKGKIMYLMREFLGDEENNIIFRFSEKKLQWCETNEQNIWNEILKMDVMYNSDESNYISFFNDSPFTKGMPKESPGRLGYWVGFQIVNQYMNNEGVSLQELMKKINSQEILLKSKYKP